MKTLEQQRNVIQPDSNMKYEQYISGWLNCLDIAQTQSLSVPTPFIRALGANEAIILSQILYWHLPSKAGTTKLRVNKPDGLWLAKSHSDWEEETGINEHTARKVINRLKDKGLIITKVMKFAGSPTIHLKLMWEQVLELIRPNGSGGNDQIGQIEERYLVGSKCPNRSEPYTETTTEITTVSTTAEKLHLGKTEPVPNLGHPHTGSQQPEPCPGVQGQEQGKDPSIKNHPSVKNSKIEIEAQDLVHDPEDLNNSAAPQNFSSAALKNAHNPAENAPRTRVNASWDESRISEIWAANKGKKWRSMGLGVLNAAVTHGLEQFLLRAQGDMERAYEYVAMSLSEMAQDDFWSKKQMNFGQVMGFDESRSCESFCGKFLGAAIERAERRQPQPAPVVVPNMLEGWNNG